MATITIEVQDKKLKFFKELLKQFSFVKIQEEEIGWSAGAVDSLEEDTDEQVVANIR